MLVPCVDDGTETHAIPLDSSGFNRRYSILAAGNRLVPGSGELELRARIPCLRAWMREGLVCTIPNHQQYMTSLAEDPVHFPNVAYYTWESSSPLSRGSRPTLTRSRPSPSPTVVSDNSAITRVCAGVMSCHVMLCHVIHRTTADGLDRWSKGGVESRWQIEPRSR